MYNLVDIHDRLDKEPTVVSVGETYADKHTNEYRIFDIAWNPMKKNSVNVIYIRNGIKFGVPGTMFDRAIKDGDLTLIR
ncbi:hypothetical protein [Paludifilum halophilum]|uniref:Uncharacterized protein n=1 Tax=Paludifilum halophilum TaxID=1642702 RepID=A0A235B879_9BACL|nr:hypothetical protein [Paludifilum halophilum]OYD08518.1 hypothetical protein CHM34_06745 [Paludifilum halophilum]